MSNAETLSTGETIVNIANALAWPANALAWLHFFWSINQHKGKHSKGIAWPRAIEIETLSTGGSPANLVRTWKTYGIRACLGCDFYAFIDNQKCRLTTFYVSSNQQWMADRHARAAGYNVQTAYVNDPRRGSSATAAQRGKWQPKTTGAKGP